MDGGLTYDKVERHILDANYFFFGNSYIHHDRTVFTILNILSDFGGISKSVFGIIGFLCSKITYNFIVAKFIKRIYKTDKRKST